jgi:hypothetical protein
MLETMDLNGGARSFLDVRCGADERTVWDMDALGTRAFGVLSQRLRSWTSSGWAALRQRQRHGRCVRSVVAALSKHDCFVTTVSCTEDFTNYVRGLRSADCILTVTGRRLNQGNGKRCGDDVLLGRTLVGLNPVLCCPVCF